MSLPPARRLTSRSLTTPIAVFAGLLTAVTLISFPGGARTAAHVPDVERTGPSRTVGIVRDTAQPKRAPVRRRASVNVGVKFTSTRPGKVTALQFYRSRKQNRTYVASLWDLDGTLLGRARFRARKDAGWQTARLRRPVSLNKGRVYVASYLASHGNYVTKPRGFSKTREVRGFIVPRHGGVIARSRKSVRPRRSAGAKNFMVDVVFKPKRGSTTPHTTTPTPTPTQTTTPTTTPPPGSWPAAHNTGVPDGTVLTTYTGPLTITSANTVISNAVVNGTLMIEAPGVQIVNSRLNGGVDLRNPRTTNASFSIIDSEVHIGDNLNTGLMRGNFYANRVDITGGRRSVYCEYNCTIENSWVHDQGGDPGGDAHFSGIRMGDTTTVRHNTITCEALRGSGTGCSAGLTGYGDFGTVQRNLIENNIFLGGGGGGSTVCAYGGSSGDDGSKPYGRYTNNVRFLNNVFVRGDSGHCGNLRAVMSFDPGRPGNVWSGNIWDDGSPISYND